MKTFAVFLIFFSSLIKIGFSQVNDSLQIKRFFSEALSSDIAYENLRYLCKKTKGRISGSPEAAAAIEFTRQVMKQMALDSVYLQDVMVPNWKPGNKEFSTITSSLLGTKEVSICALGPSIGTGDNGIVAELVEVKSFDELKQLGKEVINDKIVFFNHPMDRSMIDPFSAYDKVKDFRKYGAIKASQYGATGVVVRSLTNSIDNFPRTGNMTYNEGVKKIPAVAVSTIGAELISKWLSIDPKLKFYFRTTCSTYPDVKSHNVIGEIRGIKYPEEIIVVGGHIDAWHNTEGAHDDGAGCVQAIEVLRLFKKLNIKPKRTIRAVLFIDEEMSKQGAKKYAEHVKLKSEKHLFAIESDDGAFTPRGFSFRTNEETLNRIFGFKKYFIPYGIAEFKMGYVGADIQPLQEFDVALGYLIPDPHRYFYYHHSANDTFEQVNQRELQMGSAAIASLIYLIDKYGLK